MNTFLHFILLFTLGISCHFNFISILINEHLSLFYNLSVLCSYFQILLWYLKFCSTNCKTAMLINKRLHRWIEYWPFFRFFSCSNNISILVNHTFLFDFNLLFYPLSSRIETPYSFLDFTNEDSLTVLK